MKNKQPVVLNLSAAASIQSVTAKQGDRRSRFVECILLNQHTLETLPPTASAFYSLRKPDGKQIANPAAINGGRVVLELTPQCLAVPGTCHCEVTIYDGEVILTTASFEVRVEPNVFDEPYVTSSDEYNLFLRTVEEMQAFCDQREAIREDGEEQRRNMEYLRQAAERMRVYHEQRREEQELGRQDTSDRAAARADTAALEAELQAAYAKGQGNYARSQGDYARDTLAPALSQLTALNVCDGETPFQRCHTTIRIDGGTPFTRTQPQYRVFDGGTPETRTLGR